MLYTRVTDPVGPPLTWKNRSKIVPGVKNTQKFQPPLGNCPMIIPIGNKWEKCTPKPSLLDFLSCKQNIFSPIRFTRENYHPHGGKSSNGALRGVLFISVTKAQSYVIWYPNVEIFFGHAKL